MPRRVEQRGDFDPATRLRLIEGDADDFDERLDKIMATCVSILVSLVVASTLLAINLTVKAG